MTITGISNYTGGTKIYPRFSKRKVLKIWERSELILKSQRF